MADIRSKVLQYETFLNDVLKEDLRFEVAANKETFRTQVDLGSNFYVQAVVPDVSKIFVQVGMGFFVELTHEETLWFVGRREALLETELQRVSKESANIKAHIQMVLQGLRELQGLPADLDRPKQRDIFE
ncbi:hypothetical protein HPB52_006618 [Rhipicephalus sanguineus]|uniref:Uncharacterized protein n=1 Tax=Rhipicephalus sanguineus TaxID=34632 RepID=A0A9D4QCS1_RHISA|nr:hypothetical protein HPB52_006618 [Rhipicephalus sanguineus]